jgi:hypothetical protein
MSIHADQVFTRKARAEHTRNVVIIVKKKKPVLHWWPCKTWYHLKYKHRKKGPPESNSVHPDTPNTQLNPTPTEKDIKRHHIPSTQTPRTPIYTSTRSPEFLPPPCTLLNNLMRPQYQHSNHDTGNQQQKRNPETPTNPRALPGLALLTSKPRVSM